MESVCCHWIVEAIRRPYCLGLGVSLGDLTGGPLAGLRGPPGFSLVLQLLRPRQQSRQTQSRQQQWQQQEEAALLGLGVPYEAARSVRTPRAVAVVAEASSKRLPSDAGTGRSSGEGGSRSSKSSNNISGGRASVSILWGLPSGPNCSCRRAAGAAAAAAPAAKLSGEFPIQQQPEQHSQVYIHLQWQQRRRPQQVFSS